MGAHDAGDVVEVLLVQGDGFVEPARIPVGSSEAETCGRSAGAVGAYDAHGVCEDLLLQGDGLVESARFPVDAGQFVACGESAAVVGAQDAAAAAENLLVQGDGLVEPAGEFFVGLDGTISFLEVNTRLQVEHPVSEEVTGLDLVREMFRIAEGEELGYDDPEIHGHSIEFRINAEDAGRGFMPAPGTLVKWHAPTGPGIRVDEGYHAGMTVPGAFDSLVAKLIVTGANRPQVLARARRALGELQVEGMPTVVPFHQVLLEEPDFVAADGGFGVHTRWIETEFTNEIPAYTGVLGDPEDLGEPEVIAVEVNGRRMEVKLPAGFGARPEARGKTPKRPTRRDRGGAKVSAPSGNGLICPMQGTVVKLSVQEGEVVEEGQVVAVIEAMKMEQPLHAHRPGQVVRIAIAPGQPVNAGDVICEIIDPE